jgi:hypothetical protein
MALLCSVAAAAFACGSIAMRVLLRYAPARLAGALAQPVPVVTAWGSAGALAWALLAGTIALGALALALAWRELQDQTLEQARFNRIAIGVGSVLALTAALTWPAIFSSDIYAYATYGDLAAHGANAYGHQPLLLHDSIAHAAIVQWGNPPPVCVYGPAFVALAAAVVQLAHGDVALTLLFLRLAACAGFILSVALFWYALGGVHDVRRTRAVAAYALNPVALWCVAEGHNDALMLCFVFVGIALGRNGRAAAATGVMALGGLLKAPAVAASALAALLGSGHGMRQNARRLWLGCFLGTVAVALVGLPLERGVRAAIGVHGHYFPQFSFQAIGAALAGTPGIAGALLLCAALGVAGVRAVWAGDRNALALVASAVWLAVPNPYPWYALWILPLAAALDGPAAWALAGGTIAGVVRYFPDAVGTLDPGMRFMIACVGLSPFALALRRAAAPLRSPGMPAA